MKYITFTLLAFIQMNNFSMASNLPIFKPNLYCSEVSEVSGNSSIIYNGCLEIEQKSYNKIKVVWNNLSLQLQKYCNEVAEFSGGSYSILEGCIEMETEASSSKKEFKF